MVDKSDWRLRGQEDYLHGVTLYWEKYTQWSETWDHDHCDFCWTEFCLEGCKGSSEEGYTTEDNYTWICKQCFEDFKDTFEWKVIRKTE